MGTPNPMPDQTACGILIPPDIPDADYWLATCTEIAELEGWRVTTVVHTWRQLMELVCREEIQVVIVGRLDHLPPNRRPLVVLAEDYQRPGSPPSGDRPRRLPGQPG